MKAHPVYGVAYLIFVVAFLRQEPPSGFRRWFGTLVVLDLLWGGFALLWRVSPLVTRSLFLAYVPVRILLPLSHRDEAREVRAKRTPFPVQQRFAARLAERGSFSLAREKLRWFLAEGAWSGEAMRTARAAHRRVRARMMEPGVYHIAWDRLYERTERRNARLEFYLYEGRTAGLPREKENLPAGGRLEIPAPAGETELPSLLLDTGPVAARLGVSPDGEYPVERPPPEVPIRLFP